MTKECPKCFEEIQVESKKCKHCGTDLRKWFVRHKILTSLLALFAIPLLMNIIWGPVSKIDYISVCTYSQIEVNKKLKSPASAEHPSCREGVFSQLDEGVKNEEGYEHYGYISYVDSQNSFSAQIRTEYICKMSINLEDYERTGVYYMHCDLL